MVNIINAVTYIPNRPVGCGPGDASAHYHDVESEQNRPEHHQLIVRNYVGSRTGADRHRLSLGNQ